MENNNKKFHYVIISLLVLVFVVTLTISSYAYFTATVTGTSNNNVVTTGTMEIEFSDGPQVGLDNIIPGSYIEKTFSVRNTGTVDTYYDIYMSDLINNFADKTDLVYTLTSSNGANIEETQVPDVNTKIVQNQALAVGETHNYTLRITFKETNDNQDDNKGKTFSTVIRINEVKELETLINKVNSLADGADTTSIDVIGDTGLAYDGTEDNNLRYVGENPNNYVDIGERYTTDIYYGYYSESSSFSDYHSEYTSESECLNSLYYNKNCTKAHSVGDPYLWRIIGVMNNTVKSSGETENLVKIIRADKLGNYSWDSSKGINDDDGINQWGESTYQDGTPYEGADLMRELNNDYLGNIVVGTDGKWYSNSYDTKNTNIPNSILNMTAKSMIESVVWHLGAPDNNNGTYENQNITTTISPSVAYTRERANTNGKTCTSGTYCNDTVIRTSTWTGKIALMYLSDYGFATSGGDITNRQTCLESNLDSWSNSNISDCKNNNWLEKKQFTWTLSPSTIEPFARNAMILPIKTYPTFYDFEVYPSLYLKSSVVVTGGAGTQDNPYIIA